MKALCASDSLAEGQARGLQIDDQALVAVRRDGRVHLYCNHCPHRGVALNWREDDFLDPSGSLLRCSVHGALFLIEDGECVTGPCAGQRLQAVPCEERDGQLWLSADHL